MPTQSYQAFITRVREIQTATSIESLLEWDQETMLPPRGAELRAAQLGFIAGVSHERLTGSDFAQLLEQAERENAGDPEVEPNLREMRRVFDRKVKLPTSLVQEIARTVSLAKDAWVRARKESNFAAFAPHLEKLLDLKRQVAEKIGFTTEPYDALMDEYEPGARSADVQRVFDQVKEELVPLVAAIKSAPRRPDESVLRRPAPRETQALLNRLIASAMGFDFEAGRLDVSTHPFCSGLTPQDVRLTTRYDEHYLPMSLFGVMHEAGHGLYEQGLDPAHAFTPLGQSVSLGIHESQSRMWENLVGRSRAFWLYFYPLLQAALPAWRAVPLDDWYFAINTVKPSLIRVEADEVTYNLHIMLRFDLERRMLRGEVAVRDVPAAWNDGFKSLLGITPSSDAEGCLQDIHWSMGIFGYFPTYALGNLYACQFFKAANQALPDLPARIARGELQPLRDWLRKSIHAHGQRYRADELVKRVTGRPLGHADFMEHLRSKYQPLYGLD